MRGKFHNDDFGRSIAMDLLGDTVAVGAPKNGENGTRSGMTRVFHWNVFEDGLADTPHALGFSEEFSEADCAWMPARMQLKLQARPCV